MCRCNQIRMIDRNKFGTLVLEAEKPSNVNDGLIKVMTQTPTQSSRSSNLPRELRSRDPNQTPAGPLPVAKQTNCAARTFPIQTNPFGQIEAKLESLALGDEQCQSSIETCNSSSRIFDQIPPQYVISLMTKRQRRCEVMSNGQQTLEC